MKTQLRNEVLKWAIGHKITELIQTFNDADIEDPFIKTQALNLSYKSIETLPSFFSNFTELQFLDLSHNRLTQIPNEILELPKLIYIDISWNKIDPIPTFAKGVVVKSFYCRGWQSG